MLGNCSSVKGNQVTSVLEWAQKRGKATGIVTTTKITDATPAAAYSHSADRNWEDDSKLRESDKDLCKDIARQLIEDEPGRNIRVCSAILPIKFGRLLH